MSVELGQAIETAKKFAHDAGFYSWWLKLRSIDKMGDEWVVKYDYDFVNIHEVLTIKIGRAGNVVGFKREPKP